MRDLVATAFGVNRVKRGMKTMVFLRLRAWSVIFSLLIASSLAVGEGKRILFLGDSLTAGYGIEVDQAYPALIQKKIREAGLAWEVIPSGLSGETSAGGLRRVDWVMRRRVDALFLALGANDGLRGIEVGDTARNLQGIINKARNKNPDIQIIVAGMKVPPNLGRDYTVKFEKLYSDIAARNDAALVPFLLESVGGVKSLNLGDGIHPNPKGHAIIADTVWNILQGVLREKGS